MGALYLLLLLLMFSLAAATVGQQQAARRQPTPRIRSHYEPTVCQAAPAITYNNQRIMSNYAGYVTVIALMELQCSFCRSQMNSLLKLSQLIEQNYDVATKFLLVAPLNETAMFVHYYREYLKPYKIEVIQETATEPIWSVLGGHRFDIFVYDKCGRLSYYIPYPQSFMYYHYTISSLHSTHRHPRCGPCPIVNMVDQQQQQATSRSENLLLQSGLNDDADLNVLLGSRYNPKNVKAWMEYIRGMTTEMPETQSPAEMETFAAEVLRGEYVKLRHAGKKRNRTRIKTANRPTAAPKPVQLDRQVPTAAAATTTLWPTTTTYSCVTSPNKADQQTTVEADLSEDNDTAAQIGKPTPVTPPMTVEDRMTTTAPEHGNTTTTSSPLVYSWNPVPPSGMDCATYSDEMCLKLQEKRKSHPCCTKGIYVTRLCTPGTCTPSMNQLCCFQRYQQARHACCFDDTVPADRPDDFNRCCHGLFVNSEVDDPCCPSSIAKSHWDRQHRLAELCLPNLVIDFSDVVFQVRLKSGQLDLIRLRNVAALNYSCPYARRRSTFYLFDASSSHRGSSVADSSSSSSSSS